jgi:hypothetical protein
MPRGPEPSLRNDYLAPLLSSGRGHQAFQDSGVSTSHSRDQSTHFSHLGLDRVADRDDRHRAEGLGRHEVDPEEHAVLEGLVNRGDAQLFASPGRKKRGVEEVWRCVSVCALFVTSGSQDVCVCVYVCVCIPT